MIQTVFFGTPNYVISLLQTVRDTTKLVGIVTTPDQFVGRKQILTAPPVKVFAQKQSIPIFQPQQWNNGAIEQLQKLKPDLFVVAAYGKILPKEVLDIPKYGALNIHPSRLPEFRGPTPLQATILAGLTESAVTIIQMDEKMDHGPIIKTIPLAISSDETFETLVDKAFSTAAQALPETIEHYIRGAITPVSQDEPKATYCKILTKKDGYFDLNNPPDPLQLDRMIRAYYPWPNVWTRLPLSGKSKPANEKIMKFYPLQIVQLEGKKPVPLKEFLNGYPELKEKMKRILPES